MDASAILRELRDVLRLSTSSISPTKPFGTTTLVNPKSRKSNRLHDLVNIIAIVAKA
jgi:hypothetical protein